MLEHGHHVNHGLDVAIKTYAHQRRTQNVTGTHKPVRKPLVVSWVTFVRGL